MGEDAKLPCTASGNPTPKMHWINGEGERIDTSGSRYRVSLEHYLLLSRSSKFYFITIYLQQLKTGDLFIPKIKWTDMGVYTCVAENSLGSDSADSFLYPTKRRSEYRERTQEF